MSMAAQASADTVARSYSSHTYTLVTKQNAHHHASAAQYWPLMRPISPLLDASGAQAATLTVAIGNPIYKAYANIHWPTGVSSYMSNA